MIMNHLQNFRKLDIKTKKMISSNLAWNFKSVFRWRGIEFDEFKEYEAWEDSKHIDWLVSARENRLLSKRYALEKSIKVFFVLDIWKDMDFWTDKKKIDTLIESFLLLALSSVENWDSIGALVFDETGYKYFQTKKWKAHVFEIYKNIVEREKLKTNNSELLTLNSTFSFLSNIKLKDTLLFFLTDKMNITDDKKLKVLSLKNDTIFINIFDDFENTLNANKEDSWVLGFLSSFWKWLFVDNLNVEKKWEYKELRNNKIIALQKYLSSIWVSYLKIDNLTNIYKEFFNFFSKK